MVNMQRRTIAWERLDFCDGVGSAGLLGCGLDGVKIPHQPEAFPLACFKDTAIRVVQNVFAHVFWREECVQHCSPIAADSSVNFSGQAENRRYSTTQLRFPACNAACLPGDTSSRHSRHRPPCGANRHAPKTHPVNEFPGRFRGRGSSFPLRPTTMPQAAAASLQMERHLVMSDETPEKS